MRNRTIRYTSLFLGILVAVSIVFSHVSQISVKKEKPKAEFAAQDKNDSGEEPATVSLTSLPSHTVINFSHEVFCLFEIVFANEQDPDTNPLVILPLTKFFSTLLSVIISPNAP